MYVSVSTFLNSIFRALRVFRGKMVVNLFYDGGGLFRGNNTELADSLTIIIPSQISCGISDRFI